jgi:DNA invertase Pin-like site-specific DNA recombinase
MKKLKNLRRQKKATPKPNRCAIYARCATDVPTSDSNSTANQVRSCTEYAELQGLKIVNKSVVTDVAVSGDSIVGRNGLKKLMATAKQRPRSFDLVLIADTSRLFTQFGRGSASCEDARDQWCTNCFGRSNSQLRRPDVPPTV